MPQMFLLFNEDSQLFSLSSTRPPSESTRALTRPALTRTSHTVEELQQFSNARTPSAPWMHVMRLVVPMSSCDDAAGYLIDVLGGEDKTRQLVGGTKWWQVRGVKG